MEDTHYALTNLASRIKDDGTRIFVKLDLANADPARFFVDYEGLNQIILHLQGAAQTAVRNLAGSGAAVRYEQSRRAMDLMNVTSAQVGITADGGTVTVSAQTAQGPLVTLAFPPDLLRDLMPMLELALGQSKGKA
jgi:hypothetical protein